jgi:hypothetical protein
VKPTKHTRHCQGKEGDDCKSKTLHMFLKSWLPETLFLSSLR